MAQTTKLRVQLLEDMCGKEGQRIELLANGCRMARRVYYNKHDGLFIVVKGRMFFAYEFFNTDTVVLEVE